MKNSLEVLLKNDTILKTSSRILLQYEEKSVLMRQQKSYSEQFMTLIKFINLINIWSPIDSLKS